MTRTFAHRPLAEDVIANIRERDDPETNDRDRQVTVSRMIEGCPSKREYVALDLETTGLMAATDRIVEIGAVRFRTDGQELCRFQRLVNPERPMSPAAFAIHGLSDEVLAGAPPARDILPEFLVFLGDPGMTALLAHNASFDAGFLGCELMRAGLPIPTHSMIDTLALARRRLPWLASHRLDNVARALGLDPAGAHRALADCLRVKEIWLLLSGNSEPQDDVVSYRMFDRRDSEPTPEGWEDVLRAAARGTMIRIEYDGGTRGSTPRSITPRRFVQRGGANYLIAFCHIDSLEKSFRLDRIRCVQLTIEPSSEPVQVDRSAVRG
jgi:DNA polymerase III subunit epsilon